MIPLQDLNRPHRSKPAQIDPKNQREKDSKADMVPTMAALSKERKHQIADKLRAAREATSEAEEGRALLLPAKLKKTSPSPKKQKNVVYLPPPPLPTSFIIVPHPHQQHSSPKITALTSPKNQWHIHHLHIPNSQNGMGLRRTGVISMLVERNVSLPPCHKSLRRYPFLTPPAPTTTSTPI